MAFIEPLADDDVPELADIFALYQQTRGFVPNSVRTMARRPRLVDAFAQLNQVVLYEGSLDTEVKVLSSVIVSTAAGCRYCQSHMATRADLLGTDPDKIAAVWDYETSPLFSDAERAALRLAQAAGTVPNAATGEHFDELRKHYDEDQIVELVATLSLFGFLNRWNDTMATELEQLPLERAQRHLGAAGWDPGKHRHAHG